MSSRLYAASVAWRSVSCQPKNTPPALVQHRSDAHARSIALHYERLSEDWELEHRRRLEGAERGVGFWPPAERILVEQGREWHGNVAVSFNKTMVVSGEP
jgi:hypothetical protein